MDPNNKNIGTTHGKLFTPRLDKQRKYDVVVKEDGTHELVDRSPVSFQPTPEQITFLERLFWDWEYGLDEDKAIKSVGGQMSSVKRWKRDPAFMELYKNEANKALALGIENAKNLVVRTLDHGHKPTKDEKWAAKQMLTIEDGIRHNEYRLIQIHNTQNNYYGASAEMTEEQLQEIIKRGSNDSKTQKAISAGRSKKG